MTVLIVFICIVLLCIVFIQIGKVTELTGKIKGEEEVQLHTNHWNGILSLIFVVVFLAGTVLSALYFKDRMMGYGPHESASVHGKKLDFLFNVTLFFTGIVFVITHIMLFWFAFKYKGHKGGKASFISHDNKLEIIWTAIPAVVMTFLVVGGLDAWNSVMADIKNTDDYIEIEATGVQFNWLLRYPGADGKLGTRDFKKISPTNPIGQDWTDVKNMDDFQPSEIVLPVGKKVRVRIVGRDVLHSFFLPHFRVKMDAVPGMPTYFVFTPKLTTQQYRERIRQYPEYQELSDPKDPTSKPRWQTFDFELACAELCGQGHFSMRRLVKIVTMEEYQAWLKTQKSYYQENIRGKDEDPYKDKVMGSEVKMRKEELFAELNKVAADTSAKDKIVKLSYINFKEGSDVLTEDSKYEMDDLVGYLTSNVKVKLELDGHTDNTGDGAANQELSLKRAQSVMKYLVSKGIASARLSAKGFGSSKPLDPANTPEAKAKNRRTEVKILSK